MSLAELTVEKTLKTGVTEAEAYVSRSQTTQVEFDDRIIGYKIADSTGIGIRVALGKRLATVSTTILQPGEIDFAVERAVKIAKVSTEDPDWRHMNKRFERATARGYYDKTVETLEQSDIIETIQDSIKHMKEVDKRVIPSISLLTIVINETEIANCYGFSGNDKETTVSLSYRAKAEDSGEQSSGFEQQTSRRWKDVDFNNLAAAAATQAVRFLKTTPARNSKIPVIIKNDAFASMLEVMLSGPTSAEWVQNGRSPIANKLNSKIASDNFTLFDDGLMPEGCATRSFDDEGHPTGTTAVIEKGVLRSFLYDNYTSLKADVKSTGNAQRSSYGAPPSPGPSNFILKPGTSKPEDIIKDTKEGLYVEVTIGEWLSNQVSGNLTATVTHGTLIKNGEPKTNIRGAVISGNFYEILRNGVETIGNDTRNMGPYYSPTIKLYGLTIAGKD